MQHAPSWQATEDSAWRPAAPDAAELFGYDRLLQRRAMAAMAAAMGAMLCGLPLHLLALGGGAAHRASGAAGWLSAVLATIAIWAALPALGRSVMAASTLGRGEPAVVLCCAAAAYVVSWAGLLGGVH